MMAQTEGLIDWYFLLTNIVRLLLSFSVVLVAIAIAWLFAYQLLLSQVPLFRELVGAKPIGKTYRTEPRRRPKTVYVNNT
jgi:hypothetical protein